MKKLFISLAIFLGVSNLMVWNNSIAKPMTVGENELEELKLTSALIIYGEVLNEFKKIPISKDHSITDEIRVRVIDTEKGNGDIKFVYIPAYPGLVPDYAFPYPKNTRVLIFAKKTHIQDDNIYVDESKDGKDRIKIFTPEAIGVYSLIKPAPAIVGYFNQFYIRELKRNSNK